MTLDLQNCSNIDTSQKAGFNTFREANLINDNLLVQIDDRESRGPGLYNLDNQYGCDCGLKDAKSIQTSQPGIHLKAGVGWSGENGCMVDTDSNMRQNVEILTNRRVINQLTTRLSSTTGNLSKGYYDVDTESVIRPGEFAGDQKPCVGTTEATFGNYFLPMIPKLKEEVQNYKHIIPEDSKDDWVRGGLPTRQMIRNEDYLRRCQEKTV
jgi:hypothetical protein